MPVKCNLYQMSRHFEEQVTNITKKRYIFLKEVSDLKGNAHLHLSQRIALQRLSFTK